MQQTFRVKAVWDAEAEVFYSQSDIEGLHILRLRSATLRMNGEETVGPERKAQRA